ncbi:MAG: TonB-dependent receptor [Bacteroidia bacterium]|nr:TonB-dependent receptor [Bacteroidia bacterium]
MNSRLIFALLAMLLLGAARLGAQTVTLTGTVTDSTGAPLPGATVTLLRAKDSVLTSFGASNAAGTFLLRRAPAGEYRLIVSLMGYEQAAQPLRIAGTEGTLALPPIALLSRAVTLDAVTIEAEQTPILIRKDTVEYNAGSFATQPNAVVEDLLKKLPGVEVATDGSIKAQGEDVRRVLVDGKEFFGTDPKIATRNLPADAINKVQIFDERSEAARFTGVDDGEREKTINLTLKDDKKQGVFGNATGGYGTSNRFTFKGNVNRFAPKVKISALGMLNNTNQQGFTFEDYFNFMGGQGMGGGRGGIIRIDGSNNATGLPLGSGLGNGFVTTGSGGLNLSYDLSKKTEFNASYFFSGVGRTLDQYTYREQFTGERSFITQDTSAQYSAAYNHRFNSTLRYKADSLQRLTLRTRLGWNDSYSESSASRISLTPENQIQSGNDRSTDQDGTRMDGELSLNYQLRLGKAGRNLGVEALASGQLSRQHSGLSSINRLFPPQGTPLLDTLLQDQSQRASQIAYGGELTYMEPLGSNLYLQGSYAHRNYTDESDQEVYDLLPERRFNAGLSNQYLRGFTYDRGGLRLIFSGSKANFQANLDGQRALLRGDLISLGDTIRQTFSYLLPGMEYTYRFANTKSLSTEYETQVTEPSVQQLSPAVDNRDPLNVYAGNPELRPEYAHTLSTRLMLYDPFTFMSFFAMVRATYTQQSIVDAISVDSLLRQIRTPVNTDEAWRLTAFASFSTPVKPLKLRMSLNTNLSYNRGIAFVNQRQNTADRVTASGELRLENRNKKLVDVSAAANLSYNTARYSENAEFNRSFLNQRYTADLMVKPASRWMLRSGLDWSIYGGETFGEAQSVPLLTAGISRYLMKNRLAVELSAFDLLNQNQGISRSADLTYVEEVRTVTLARYALLTLSYSLSGFGNSGGPPGGPRMMMRMNGG